MIDNDMTEVDYESLVKASSCSECGCNFVRWNEDCQCTDRTCNCYMQRTDDWSYMGEILDAEQGF